MIKPTEDNIVVKTEPEEKMQGSLVLVEHEKGTVRRGVVVAVGDGRKTKKDVLVPVEVQVGDTVYFDTKSQTVTKMFLDDAEHYVIAESDVSMIVYP